MCFCEEGLHGNEKAIYRENREVWNSQKSGVSKAGLGGGWATAKQTLSF